MKHLNFLLAIGTFLLFSTVSISQIQLGQDIDGEDRGDESGRSISMSADGSIVAIGAAYFENNGQNVGHVRVYEYDSDNDVWERFGQDIVGLSGDNFGFSVSLSADGSRLAASSIFTDNNSGMQTGVTRIYEYNPSNGWEQLGDDIFGEADLDWSGLALSMNANGSRVAISAPLNNGTDSDSGHVRVYEFGTITGWQQIGNDIDGEGRFDESGRAISLSGDGNRLAIGAPFNDGNGIDSGQVRVFDYNLNSGWQQIGEDIYGSEENELSGFAIDISSDGSHLAVSSESIGTSIGDRVRIFKYVDSIGWQQVGNDLIGENSSDRFGRSVSLNANGSIVAIGASSSHSNGDFSGQAAIYQYDNSSGWQQVGEYINGENPFDEFGTSISLNADGSRVAIGTPKNQDNGVRSGHVRIYSLEGLLSLQDFSSQKGVTILPNPSSGTANIDIPQAFGTTIQVTVVELGSGKLVKNFTAITGTNQVEFNGLANGVYIIKIVSETASSTHRLILAK